MRSVGLAVAMLVIATASAGGEVRRIRLCADPSNLPFSSQDTNEPGFELEIARAIAGTLGVELSVHWFPTVREVVTLRYQKIDWQVGNVKTGRDFAGNKNF